MSKYSYAISPIKCPLCRVEISLTTLASSHLKHHHKNISYDIKRQVMEMAKKQAWKEKTKNNII